MGNEIETRTGTYTGIKQDKKRWLLYFNEGGEEEQKYSAFDPLLNLNDLKIGQQYRYKVEHVPMPKEQGKFYHNLARTGRDAAFAIEGIEQPAKQPPTPKPPEQKEQPTQEPSALQKEYNERIAKEKAEKAQAEEAKQRSISRGGYSHDASQILGDLEKSGTIKITAKAGLSTEEKIQEILKLATEYHDIILGHLQDNAAKAEEKFRAELANGSLKPQKAEKKEPVEALLG